MRRLGLPADDVLRDPSYRRLWLAVLMGSLGAQVTLLALPLSAAVLLHATPMQMGVLTAIEALPFVLLALPTGVWLDRVRKLPVLIGGEALLALSMASVAVAWLAGWLTMGWLYAVGFIIGAVNTTAGTAGQIVLTQVVPRERLVQAHARNALASSGAEVVGPGLAGLLIRAVGAPLAMVLDAALLLTSVAILRGLRVRESLAERPAERAGGAAAAWRGFVRELDEGLRFVLRHPLLRRLAVVVGVWQFCQHAAQGVLILHASRSLGLSESAIGACWMVLGLGTIAAGSLGDRLSDRIGPGPAIVVGFACSAVGWGLPALWHQPGGAGTLALALGLLLGGVGGVLVFINFIALRQAATPPQLLGRMTASLRWLILLPALPGALAGGWLGQALALHATLGLAAGLALLLVLGGRCTPVIWQLRSLPTPAPA